MTPASSSNTCRLTVKQKAIIKDCLPRRFYLQSAATAAAAPSPSPPSLTPPPPSPPSDTFYAKQVLHQTTVPTKNFDTKQPLYIPTALSTPHLLHQTPFTSNDFYAKQLSHHTTLPHTKQQTHFASNNIYTKINHQFSTFNKISIQQTSHLDC